MKVAISIRLDQDIIEFFKNSSSEGYQKGIAAVLRSYKERQTKAEAYTAGRAQEIYRQYHAQCFWHLRKDLKITPQMISLVQEGLRQHGGKIGFALAAELDQERCG